MGEAKNKAPVYDKRLDKSLTTVADIESMKEQVETWTQMVQKHVTDGLAEIRRERGESRAMALSDLYKTMHEEVQTLRNLVEEYRLDEMRYRQSRTWRGRMRRWFGIAQPSPMPGSGVAG